MDIQTVKRYQKQLLKYVEVFNDLLGRRERQHWCLNFRNFNVGAK